jgi:hypothetical protein
MSTIATKSHKLGEVQYTFYKYTISLLFHPSF